VRLKIFVQEKTRQSDDVWDWCIVEHSNQVFRAQIQHVGRSKFKILNDNQEKTHVGKIVDASEIFNCER
jgi:hypothetical protein